MSVFHNPFWTLGLAAALMFGCCSSSGAAGSSEPRAGASCSGEVDAIVSISGSTLIICGVINGRLIDRLPERLSDITDIRMTSAGGSGFAAMSLAITLNEHVLPVTFEGLCASACLDLFILTDAVSISGDALFLTHSSVRGRLAMISRSRTWQDRDRLGLDTASIERAVELTAMASTGAPVDWRDYQIEATAALGPLCAGGIADDQLLLGSPAGVLYFESEYDYWLPTEASLIRWRQGRPASGLPGEYDAQLRTRIAANFYAVTGVNLRPILVDSEVLVARAWFEAQTEFRICAQ
tara:strand:- start:496 stop:1380 length:885 start_codon:yes stop_codon:yes gene_type:complete